MALIDSLLLEPSPFEIWVAYRTDRQKGTGTIADPFDGSPEHGPQVSIQALANPSANQEAVVTNSPHSFNDGDVITIAGATGESKDRWNGTFVIYAVDGAKTSFKYYMTGVPVPGGPGSAAITAARVLSFRFDTVMGSLGEKVRVHLGPTPSGQPFLTRGYADGVSGGWQLKAGMRITGAGTDVTVLRLVPAWIDDSHFYAVGHALSTGSPVQPNVLDFVEVSDLTIDCNSIITTASMPTVHAVACGAIRLMGNHGRVSRVRAINWGTNAVFPCFAISLLTGDRTIALTEVDDCGIENCIVVQPAQSPSDAPVTALHVGGKEGAASEAEAFGKGPFIRNCFVDCQWPSTASPMESCGLSMGRCRAGVVEGNQIHNTAVGGPRCENTTIKELVVRNNLYKNVAKAVDFSLGQAWPDSMGAGSMAIALVVDRFIGSVTIADHGLVPGDRVQLVTNHSGLNGIYRVIEIDGDTFKVVVPASFSSPSVNQAFRVFSADKLIIESNIIELANGAAGLFGIHLSDNAAVALTPDYPYGDVIVRDNKIRYVDGIVDPANVGSGIHVSGARNLIVRNNIIECVPADPIRHMRCGAVTYSNNRNPAGILIEGMNPDTAQRTAELETENDLALILSLFNRRAR